MKDVNEDISFESQISMALSAARRDAKAKDEMEQHKVDLPDDDRDDAVFFALYVLGYFISKFLFKFGWISSIFIALFIMAALAVMILAFESYRR